MKNTIICLLLLVGATYSVQAQDKLVLRNGRTVEVNVQRIVEDLVKYTYPGETVIYERPKNAISYILYEDGRKEILDESLRETEKKETRTSTKTKSKSSDNEIFWQDIKTTFNDAEVKNMTRLKRISATSIVSYKDAIQNLKKSAAAIGATTILVMDIPENEDSDEIEVMGIAYRDEEMIYTPKTTAERNTVPVESSSNVRRRRIAQQMESYNDDSKLEFEDYSEKPQQKTTTTTRDKRAENIETYDNADSPDAIYLMSGRVIRGTIEEFEPDDFVSIRTAAGKIHEYSMDDVKRVSRGSTRANAKATQKSKSTRNTSKYDDDNRYNRASSKSTKKEKDNYYNDYRVSGYKGIFEAGYTLSFGVAEKGRFEMSTTHGYQLNQNLFVGAGVGLHIYSARDPEMKKNMGTDKYPQYADGTKPIEGDANTYPTSYARAMDSSFMMLPVFAELRGYLPLENSSLTPFASVKIGYTFNLSDDFGPSGLYFSPSVGAKFNISPKIGLLVSLGYTFQGLGDPKTTTHKDSNGNTITTINKQYGFYYRDTDKVLYKTTSAQGINIKVGIEF